MKTLKDEIKELDKKLLFGDERTTYKKYDIVHHILWLKFTKLAENKNGENQILDIKIVPIALNSSDGAHTKIKDIKSGTIYSLTEKGQQAAYDQLISDLNCEKFSMQEFALPELIYQIRNMALSEDGVSVFDQTKLATQKAKITEMLKEQGVKLNVSLPRLVECRKILNIADACTDFFCMEAQIVPARTKGAHYSRSK